KSVHLTEFARLDGASLSAVDASARERIFRVRETETKVLERARAAQQIGQSLEADIELHTEMSPEALAGDVKVDLAKLFIVSHVDFRDRDDSIADFIELDGLGRIGVTMKPARGKKCGRCWQYREEVQEAGLLCGRCQSVLDQLAPTETATV
ncbi:MAG: zinc finger domain-containing protein, partial [Thermoanaerobaculia bacterium]